MLQAPVQYMLVLLKGIAFLDIGNLCAGWNTWHRKNDIYEACRYRMMTDWKQIDDDEIEHLERALLHDTLLRTHLSDEKYDPWVAFLCIWAAFWT